MEAIKALQSRRQSGSAFEVWPDNLASVTAFLAVSTQWKAIAQMDGAVYWQGLDYSGVTAGLTGAGIASSADLWRDLRVMEGAARNRLNGIIECD